LTKIAGRYWNAEIENRQTLGQGLWLVLSDRARQAVIDCQSMDLNYQANIFTAIESRCPVQRSGKIGATMQTSI